MAIVLALAAFVLAVLLHGLAMRVPVRLDGAAAILLCPSTSLGRW